MAKVDKEKLIFDICYSIGQNNFKIGEQFANKMKQCFEPIDLIRVSAFCAVSFLKCFTDNTSEQLILELSKAFEEMKQNILKEKNEQQ